MRKVGLLAVLIVVAACDSAYLQRGAVIHKGDSFSLEMPMHVLARVPVEITVRTQTGACDWAGPTYKSLEGRVLTIEPFDYIAKRDLCDLKLVTQLHTVTVVFPDAGDGLVRVVGYHPLHGDTVFQRAIVIR